MKAFKRYPSGYAYFAVVRSVESKLYVFVAIDRTLMVCCTEFHEQATAVDLLQAVTKSFPHNLHTGLTDNGTQFTNCGETGPYSDPSLTCYPPSTRYAPSTVSGTVSPESVTHG